MLGSEWWRGGDSWWGKVPLRESGLVKEAESNKEMLLKRGEVVRGGDGAVVAVAVVVVVEEGDEEGPEEARITKLPHGVCKQKSRFKTSLPWVTNFSYTSVKYDSNFFSHTAASFSQRHSRGPLKWYN
jgi:hypothetical protein